MDAWLIMGQNPAVSESHLDWAWTVERAIEYQGGLAAADHPGAWGVGEH